MKKKEVQVLLVTSDDGQLLVDVARMARKGQAQVNSYSQLQWQEYLSKTQRSNTFGQRPTSVPELRAGANALPPLPANTDSAAIHSTATHRASMSTSASPVQRPAQRPSPRPSHQLAGAASKASPIPKAASRALKTTSPHAKEGGAPLGESAAAAIGPKTAIKGQVISFASSNTINDVQRQAVLSAVAKCKGNVSQAAQQLGVGRATLYRKFKLYGITVDNARPENKKTKKKVTLAA